MQHQADKGHVDALVGHLLDRLGQLVYLGALLLAGRRDVQRQQVAQGIDRQVNFRAFLRLWPS